MLSGGLEILTVAIPESERYFVSRDGPLNAAADGREIRQGGASLIA